MRLYHDFRSPRMKANLLKGIRSISHRVANLSVFYKLLAWFLLSVLPLSVVFIVINIRSSANVRSQHVEALEARTRHYFELLEQEITSILTLQREYVNEPDIQMMAGRASIMSPYNIFMSVRNIETRLAYLVNFSKYIKEVSVYLPSYGKVLSGTMQIREAEKELLQFLLSANSFVSGPLFYHEDELYLNLPYPSGNPYVSKRDPNLVITIKLAINQFAARLAQFVEYENEAAAFYSPKSGWSVVHSPRGPDPQTVTDLATNVISSESPTGTMDWQDKSHQYVVIHRYSEILDLGIVVCFPVETVLAELQRYRFYLLLFSGLTLAFLVFYAWIMFRTINIPLSEIVNSFKLVENGNLDIELPATRADEFGYVMGRFGVMVERLKETIQLEYESRIHANQAELKQLQYQINPHFLYNSLYMIHRMAKVDDVENISRLSRHLSRYYMYISRGETLLVTLKEESNHAQDYLAIQAMRFHGRITTAIDNPPEDWAGRRVPRLIIQPILENAFQHGLEENEEGGHVRVAYLKHRNTLDITIENSGQVPPDALRTLDARLKVTQGSTGTTTGLVNVHRRLQIAFGAECGVFFANTDSGFCVTLRVADEPNIE
jgi:two-component system, sensor histidine kinase YesM